MSHDESWICRNCEQANDAAVHNCQSCGTRRPGTEHLDAAAVDEPADVAQPASASDAPAEAQSPLPSMNQDLRVGPPQGAAGMLDELRQMADGVPWGFTWIVITLLYLILTFKF